MGVLPLFASESTWVWSALGLLSIPALVALNGFFVAAEFALVAVRKTRIEEMVSQGVVRAKAVLTALDHLDRYIAATQLGITLASLALGMVSEPALARLIEPAFGYLNEAWRGVAAHSVATALAFTIITFMHVVFGELIPKTMALQVPDVTALWVARPLIVFASLTRPLIIVMNGMGNQILRLCGFRSAGGAEMVHSVEELLLLIEDTEEAGILDAGQADIVGNVFRMTNRRVEECMVPSEKMAALELSMPPEKIMEAVRSGAHTRMPVYEGDPHNIVGIVNTKDLFYLFSLRGIVVLEDALYPPLYLKPDEQLDNALRLFRKAKRPMALVRGEDGKIVGLITLEDVIEEIVGDIEDEHDRPGPKILRKRRRIFPRPGSSPPRR